MKRYHTSLFIRLNALLLFFVLQVSCKKFVEIDPPVVSTNDEIVYKSDPTATSVLTGLYSNMSISSDLFGNSGLSMTTGLAADELTLDPGVAAPQLDAFYRNNLVENYTTGYGSGLWSALYRYIFWCNAAIKGITASSSLSAPVKDQLLGEAKLMRAFLYFYLTNLYGEAVLTEDTDPLINSHLGRSSVASIYQLILSDLTEAKDLLSEDFLDGTLQPYTGGEERVRPTKWAAYALLARVYLYLGDWEKSESAASAVIGHNSKFNLTPLNDVFLKNSEEAIWELQSLQVDRNTNEGFAYIIPAEGPSSPNGSFGGNPAYLSNLQLNSFETNDQRKVFGNWINEITVAGKSYKFPYKYKAITGGITEYQMVFRLGEQFLIRAEARAQQNNISGAQEDMDAIRTRAGLPGTTANDQPGLLNAIKQERRVELFTEWGDRWLDLKRTHDIDAVMSQVTPLKTNGAQWRAYQALFPIPFNDLLKGVELKQNPGYE